MRYTNTALLGGLIAATLLVPRLGMGQDFEGDFGPNPFESPAGPSFDFEDVVAIIGGEESSLGRFPATTALLRVSPTQNLFQRQFCAGTAISDSYILTAAHCMFGAFGALEPDELLVAGNFIDLANETPAEIPVAQIFVHPSYDDDNLLAEHDLAILRTSVPHNIPPIALFSGDARSLTGVTASIAGWGVVRMARFPGDSTLFPTVLNEAAVPITDFATCDGVYQGRLNDAHVCAGFEEGGVDACQGDSGGPLMINDGGVLFQVGITSFGNGCALPNAFGVYTNVEMYESWVNGIVPSPSTGNAVFRSPERFGGGTLVAGGGGDGGGGGGGSADRAVLLLLFFGTLLRAFGARVSGFGSALVHSRACNKLGKKKHQLISRLLCISAVALVSAGCVSDLTASTGVGYDSTDTRGVDVSAAGIDLGALIKASSEHKDLPMFDSAALSEKRTSAIKGATERYGVEPICDSKKVAPQDSKRADFYERCDFNDITSSFKGGTINSVSYHFMSGRIVQIDSTLHGSALAMEPLARALDEMLGESAFSVSKVETTSGSEGLPQAVYHWMKSPQLAVARLMTEAGADTESFLLTIQHPKFTDVIDELSAL